MNKQRILIADDEEGIRESLNLVLGEKYELIYAHDGHQTLEMLSNDNFAVALVDIKIPKLDGIEVLRKAKANGCTTPILMLTAYQSVELAKEAIKLGALDYLPKPFEREHILNAVSETILSSNTIKS